MGADVRRIPRATLASNDTAVLVDLDPPAYLKNISRLLPDTTNLGVVIGNSTIERFWTEEFRCKFQPFAALWSVFLASTRSLVLEIKTARSSIFSNGRSLNQSILM